MKKILFGIILFLVIFIFNYIQAYYEPGSNEYIQREQEAKNIINSVNPPVNNNFSSNTAQYVYIEDDKPLYHSYGCTEIAGIPHKINLEIAISNGYYACPKCFAYISTNNDFDTQKDTPDNFHIIFGIIIICFIILILYIIFNEKRYKKMSEKNNM